jgi:DNA-directed RNA polymerase sigma subunit (sigma70/sigma32)
MKEPKFNEILKLLNLKEAIIISLTLGYIDGKCFTTNSIAKFLKIPKDEVREITKKILMTYQEKLNNIINKNIPVTSNKSLIKKK